MVILYKIPRNVRFVLFSENSIEVSEESHT